MAQQAIQSKFLIFTKITTPIVIILSLISLFADCVTITSIFGSEMAFLEGICSPSLEELEKHKQSKLEPQTKYSILETQSQFVTFAKTQLSIQFQNYSGEEFVSLYISPQGHQSIVKAIVGNDTFEFKSSTGIYFLSVLNIDYQSRTVLVQVSQK